MNIGIIAPLSIAAVNGGVRTQAVMTAKHLEKLGVNVSLISPWDDLNSMDFDLYHVFAASTETAGIVSRLFEQGKKIVLSPVTYSNRSVSTIQKLLMVEKQLKKITRGFSTELSIKREICLKADILLPNTSKEALLINKGFKISDQKITIVPNGVESRFKDAIPSSFMEKHAKEDFVLFAGQASAPRKNVSKLIQAFKNIDAELVIVGDFDSSTYSLECLKMAKKNNRIKLIPTLPHDSDLLASAYAACKVFVLPSQYETPGIAAMEAALTGANIVITEVGGTKDYFNGFADYINPSSVMSIENNIEKALKRPKTNLLKDHILINFTWNKVAEQTLTQYKKVLV